MREPGTVQRRGGSLGPEALFRNIGSSTAGLGSGPRTSAVWRFPALWTSLNATPRDGGISAGGSRKVRGVSRAGYKDRTRGIHGHGTGFVVGRAADIVGERAARSPPCRGFFTRAAPVSTPSP